MTEINVISRTQHIIVEPTSGQVSVVHPEVQRITVQPESRAVSVVHPDPQVITIEPETRSIAVISAGPQGPPGPPGPPGPDIDGYYGSYMHDQTIPSNTWVIDHNLEYHPAVSVVDSSGTTVEGDIVYNTVNRVTITFSAEVSGKAYLS